MSSRHDFAVSSSQVIAIAFVLPLAPHRRWVRHARVILFCIATHPVAPVAGFGRLLLAMGAASAETTRWQVAFAGAWVFVLAGTALPWTAWLAGCPRPLGRRMVRLARLIGDVAGGGTTLCRQRQAKVSGSQ